MQQISTMPNMANVGRLLTVSNPAKPSEVVGTIVRGTPGDVERAIGAARDAQPLWNARGCRERAAILARAVSALDRAAAVAKQLEAGSVFVNAHGTQLRPTPLCFTRPGRKIS